MQRLLNTVWDVLPVHSGCKRKAQHRVFAYSLLLLPCTLAKLVELFSPQWTEVFHMLVWRSRRQHQAVEQSTTASTSCFCVQCAAVETPLALPCPGTCHLHLPLALFRLALGRPHTYVSPAACHYAACIQHLAPHKMMPSAAAHMASANTKCLSLCTLISATPVPS